MPSVVYWLPKVCKKPFKARYIIAPIRHWLDPFSKVMSCAFKLVFK